MVGTCLPVRVYFFVPKAASYLAQAFFFTEKCEPVGSYLSRWSWYQIFQC